MVRAKLFARFRELLGDELVFEEGITVKELRSRIEELLRAKGEQHDFILIAVNGMYAPDDRVISSGDEVAVFPPVSGG